MGYKGSKDTAATAAAISAAILVVASFNYRINVAVKLLLLQETNLFSLFAATNSSHSPFSNRKLSLIYHSQVMGFIKFSAKSGRNEQNKFYDCLACRVGLAIS